MSTEAWQEGGAELSFAGPGSHQVAGEEPGGPGGPEAVLETGGRHTYQPDDPHQHGQNGKHISVRSGANVPL